MDRRVALSFAVERNPDRNIDRNIVDVKNGNATIITIALRWPGEERNDIIVALGWRPGYRRSGGGGGWRFWRFSTVPTLTRTDHFEADLGETWMDRRVKT